MRNPFKKWLKGMEVSEVTLLVLPFVQISLKPAEDINNTNPSNSNNSAAFEQTPVPQHKINLSIKLDGSENLVKEGSLKADFLFRRPSEFIADIPTFKNAPWKNLSGQISFHSGEVLWLLGRYENLSNRVLYKLPMTMSSLPFVGSLNGFIHLSTELNRGNWIGNLSDIKDIPQLASGIVIEHINPKSAVFVHCFCRVPVLSNQKNKSQFTAYELPRFEVKSVIRGLFDDSQVRITLCREHTDKLAQDFVSSYNSDSLEKFFDRNYDPSYSPPFTRPERMPRELLLIELLATKNACNILLGPLEFQYGDYAHIDDSQQMLDMR